VNPRSSWHPGSAHRHVGIPELALVDVVDACQKALALLVLRQMQQILTMCVPLAWRCLSRSTID
jgi:hypothetical protein